VVARCREQLHGRVPAATPAGALRFLTAGHCTNDASQAAYGQSGHQNRLGTSNAGGTFSVNGNEGDMGVVTVDQAGWTTSAAVNTWGQPAITVTGSAEAIVGDNVCHSGNTSKWQCGTVNYVNQTVNYGIVIVAGPTFSTACSLGGDSGGAWLLGTRAVGLHSGGPSQCVANPTKDQSSIFQPVNEALAKWGLTLLTGTTTPPSGAVTVTPPGSQTGTVGTAASLQIQAATTNPGATLSYSATGLPAGLAINAQTGLISGTPTTAGSYSVTVTAQDTTGASGSATFGWTITGGSGSCAGQKLANPGFESGRTGWSGSTAAIAQWGSARTGTWSAWLAGYGHTASDQLWQAVAIPSGCRATLALPAHRHRRDPAGRVRHADRQGRFDGPHAVLEPRRGRRLPAAHVRPVRVRRLHGDPVRSSMQRPCYTFAGD
jgi:hypothetical protein